VRREWQDFYGPLNGSFEAQIFPYRNTEGQSIVFYDVIPTCYKARCPAARCVPTGREECPPRHSPPGSTSVYSHSIPATNTVRVWHASSNTKPAVLLQTTTDQTSVANRSGQQDFEAHHRCGKRDTHSPHTHILKISSSSLYEALIQLNLKKLFEWVSLSITVGWTTK
jgi:hypothetical protein